MTDRPTTVRFTPADLELIRQLQERTGIGTNSDVIRFALRYLERHGPMRPEEEAVYIFVEKTTDGLIVRSSEDAVLAGPFAETQLAWAAAEQAAHKLAAERGLRAEYTINPAPVLPDEQGNWGTSRAAWKLF
jgi:Arc/MetJ-type ribon-helix-helix transcriptional regulator